MSEKDRDKDYKDFKDFKIKKNTLKNQILNNFTAKQNKKANITITETKNQPLNGKISPDKKSSVNKIKISSLSKDKLKAHLNDESIHKTKKEETSKNCTNININIKENTRTKSINTNEIQTQNSSSNLKKL